MYRAMEGPWLMSFLVAATIVTIVVGQLDFVFFDTNPKAGLCGVIASVAVLMVLVYFLIY